MSNQLVALDYYGQAILAYLIDGQRHALSDEQVGKLLGYKEPNKSIKTIVSRDFHGELKGLATTLSLTGVEGDREVTRQRRVWGREGVIALAMLSATENGAKVRAWARKALLDSTADPMAAMAIQTHNINELTASLSKSLPAIVGRVAEITTAIASHGDRLSKVEERQRQTDPVSIERRMALLHEIKALLIAATKGADNPVTFRSYWGALQKHVGVASFSNRAALTVELMDKAIAFARNWCFERGVQPPGLLQLVG